MAGQKIDWMRHNPKVCIEIDEIDDQFHWTTLVVFGHYEEIRDTALEASVRAHARELFEQREQWWFPGAGKIATADEHHRSVVYRVRIGRMTGRRAARPPA
jgi:nitroimidazol reductase NimA-like FMN-containing flavoprotein (pyridoxamine 5'-phosphate oxidase superfamily)